VQGDQLGGGAASPAAVMVAGAAQRRTLRLMKRGRGGASGSVRGAGEAGRCREISSTAARRLVQKFVGIWGRSPDTPPKFQVLGANPPLTLIWVI
jgi:hypothetical protein